ncbi:hypothetical protein [Chromobacterium violaceum]|nr:hypothetical protein [Chromobacterium violaceum]
MAQDIETEGFSAFFAGCRAGIAYFVKNDLALIASVAGGEAI